MKDRFMIELDTDLLSRQNARELVRNAKQAQVIMATFRSRKSTPS